MNLDVPAEDVAGGIYGKPQLSQSLQNRHISMIAIGGIIGAGLFVGSSTTISQVGPAAVVTYALGGMIIMLVMRMISEMAAATPGVQTFPDFARNGLGHWAGFLSGWLYWYFWWWSRSRRSPGPRSCRSGCRTLRRGRSGWR